MITAVVSTVVFLASSAGASHCGHDRVRQECSVCVVENPEVREQIARLQSAPTLIGRRRAARALRRFDWKSHPEVADALAAAVLHDRNGLVRQEAAESLAKMRPCLPSVHESVARAAKSDPSLLTRLWARKALKSLGTTCVETCSVCQAGSSVQIPGEVIVPGGSRSEPMELESTVEPLPTEPGTRELPASPPAPSPFRPRGQAAPSSPSPALDSEVEPSSSPGPAPSPPRPASPASSGPALAPDEAPADGPALESPVLSAPGEGGSASQGTEKKPYPPVRSASLTVGTREHRIRPWSLITPGSKQRPDLSGSRKEVDDKP